jgi:hypothetical protein
MRPIEQEQSGELTHEASVAVMQCSPDAALSDGEVTARLRALRAMVSSEYAAAIDFALCTIEGRLAQVERAAVVQLLAERATRTDYTVLRSVLHEMVAAVRGLPHPGSANAVDVAHR